MKTLAWVLVLALAQAPAKPTGDGKAPRPAGGPFLLASPALQGELALSPAQVEKVEPTLRELAKTHEAEIAAVRDLPPSERLAKQRALVIVMNGELKSALGFTPKQSKRFDQVSLQSRRFEAFSDPEVVERLGLNEAQVQKIEAIRRDSRRRMQEITEQAAKDRPAALKRVAALNRVMTAQAVGLLEPEQKAEWVAMTGDPFELFPEPPAAKAPR